MTEPTEGPWSPTEGGGIRDKNDDPLGIVCATGDCGYGGKIREFCDTDRANCRVMAASRSMLDIMRRVDAWSRKNDKATPPLENFDLWHDFETVLAEAEGREPDYSFEECERSELIHESEGS